ncbi:MAG TPA: hypothetical protein VGZ71_05055 [Puia sp.]|jgi:hypothetical protein|nr:hypothetical protein [Puia sp.]
MKYMGEIKMVSLIRPGELILQIYEIVPDDLFTLRGRNNKAKDLPVSYPGQGILKTARFFVNNF